MTDLSIIIVNWNSTSYVLDCVKSVYAHTHDIRFEIIVVDNNSPDGDADEVRQRFPDVVLIKSPENLGFARANNLGFQAAKGEMVVFLNPDTVLTNPAFDLMLQKFRSLPSVGAVGCTLLNHDQSIQTSAIQTFPTALNQLLDIDVIRNRFPACSLWNIAPLFAGGSEPSQVEVISGACLMLRREIFARVGMFSDDYFMYAEDLDLCFKLVRAGYANYFLPQGRIIHFGGKSSNATRATVMKWKSILHYIAKHRGLAYLFLFRIAMACSAMTRLVFMALWLGARGKMRDDAGRGRLLKWWLILKTMAAYSEPAPAARPVAISGKTGSSVLAHNDEKACLRRG
jgi:hypothetical protein